MKFKYIIGYLGYYFQYDKISNILLYEDYPKYLAMNSPIKKRSKKQQFSIFNNQKNFPAKIILRNLQKKYSKMDLKEDFDSFDLISMISIFVNYKL